MSTVHIEKKFQSIIVMLLIYCVFLITPGAAIGEASMSLYVYVPPGEYSGGGCGGHQEIPTATYIIVTATLDDTVVDIIDLDATIGDPTDTSFIDAVYPVVDESDYDLSEYDVHLDMGQSRVIKVSYIGDNGAPDSDGTYFHVSATKPVTVYTGTALAKGQADFVPSNTGTMIGNSFFVYLPDCYEYGFNYNYDLVVFAYEDYTNVSIYKISPNQTLVEMNDELQLNATTTIDFSKAILIADKTLCPITPSAEYPPILYRQATKRNGIEKGYTYLVTADKDISVASVGIFNDNNDYTYKSAGDGAYFVPGISDNPYRSGTGMAHIFYMQLSNLYDDHCKSKGYENEIYLINYNSTDTAYVTIEEYNPSNHDWEEILDEYGYPYGIFTVEKSSILDTDLSSQNKLNHPKRFRNDGLVRITSRDNSGNPMDISVFSGVGFRHEYGCKKNIPGDIAAFSSGDTGYGGSKETILYIPPPVYQTLFCEEYTHVYIYIHHNNTNLTIQAWSDDLGWQNVSGYTNINKEQIIDYRINPARYDDGQNKLRILSSERTTVQVSNWKNNWASYVPGGTQPQFSTKLSIQSRYMTIKSIPAPRMKYSFDVTNGAIGNIGSDLYDLSVINTIPDGINQNNIYWSVCSNTGNVTYDSYSANLVSSQSPIDTDKGIKYIWENTSNEFKVTIYAYNNGSGTALTFNNGVIRKDETLTFTLITLLNETYYDQTLIRSGSMVIDISADAKNPFLGDISTYVKPSGTIILNYLTPGVIKLY